jgi:hypothetical protein
MRVERWKKVESAECYRVSGLVSGRREKEVVVQGLGKLEQRGITKVVDAD